MELGKLTIRSKIQLSNENITKIVPSNLHSHILYMTSSKGVFYLFDSRGTGSFPFHAQLHCTGIMDFGVTMNEKFVITSSLDRTVNMILIDENILDIKKQGYIH